MRARTFRSAAAAAALLCCAAAASGHETNVLDLERIEERVFAALEDPGVAGRTRAAYTALLRTFGRSSRGLVSRDLAKVAAAADACKRKLADDAVLDALVDSATADAAAKLTGESDDLAELARRVFGARDRADLLRRTERAAALRDRGVAASERGAKLRRFRAAALEFEAARAFAGRVFAKQRRRPSPGQTLHCTVAGLAPYSRPWVHCAMLSYVIRPWVLLKVICATSEP